MSDAAARARELLAKATPGSWEVSSVPPIIRAWGPWGAYHPVTDDMRTADAELIAAAPTLLAELADEVERLRALTTVDGAMVNRAAVSIYGEAFKGSQSTWGMASQSMRDSCRTLARVALEAVLGVES